MYRNSVSGFLVILSTCLPPSADAQQPQTAPAPATATQSSTAVPTLVDAVRSQRAPEGRALKRQAQRDPLVRSGLTLPEPQLTLETTKGKGRATGTIGWVKEQVGGELSVGLATSTPIGDADDAESRPVDLRGVSDGATVALSISGSSLFKTFSNSQVIDICTTRRIPTADCTAGKLETADPEVSKALLDLVFRRLPVLYGVTFRYGRNEFSFHDTSGTKQDPVRHNDVQAEGSLGVLVNGRKDLLAFYLTYSDTFAASPNKTQLCRPLAATSASRCDQAVIGEPLEERSAIATIEYRWQLRTDVKMPVAFAPKVQFARGLDGAEDVTSLEAPFYFFHEKADPKASTTSPKLNGGVSAGWRSDNGFQAAVFIGATFNLFKL